MEKINDLDIGTAGEHLVCADLILKGHKAFLSAAGLHYDILTDLNGSLIKIQVKTTRKPSPISLIKDRSKRYLINIRRMGKNGRKEYTEKEVDVFAVVALDIKKIAYIPIKKIQQTMVFRDEKPLNQSKEARYFDDLTFEKAMEEYYESKM